MIRKKMFWLACFGITIAICLVDNYLSEMQPPNAVYDRIAVTSAEESEYTSPSYSDGCLEDKRVYNQDRPDDVSYLYLTIPKEQDQNLTFYDVNNQNPLDRSSNIHVEAIFQEGDENEPQSGLFQFETNEPNSTVYIRGASSRRSPQHSYKIKLSDSAGLWKSQKTISLIKSTSDPTRVRNKLSYDLMKLFPEFLSYRTCFVHLYIKDLTDPLADSNYKDYGWFTQVEQPNELYLKNHGLNPNDHLYKANFFEFLEYPEICLKDDPDYDRAKFENILEIKANDDHTKLLAMIHDVNDMTQNINDVVEEHFDRDNYLTWLAFNLIIGNFDSDNQNYMLYNPVQKNKWYFIPWDCDGAWGHADQNQEYADSVPMWRFGLSCYWGRTLENRFFKDPANVQALIDKVDEIAKIISEDNIRILLDSYYPVAQQSVNNSPDRDCLPLSDAPFEANFSRLATIPQENIDKFMINLQKPMPIYLGVPEIKEKKITFYWDQSYDLQGDDLEYDFQLSKDPSFTSVIKQSIGLKITSLEMDCPESGRYYWKVTVRDEKGNMMIAFDRYFSVEGDVFNGVKMLSIP